MNDALFRVRDADGVQRLEDGLLLYENGRIDVPHQVDDLLKAVSKRLFGIVRGEVYIAPGDFESAIEEAEYEEDFETSLMDNEEAAEFLADYGIDFTDGKGHALRCTRVLKLQAEAAAKGYGGHMPDPSVLLEKMETSLQAQAASFMARKAHR